MNEDSDGVNECRGCDGTGYVRVPRALLLLETREVSTVMALSRCRHCRDTPVPRPGDGLA